MLKASRMSGGEFLLDYKKDSIFFTVLLYGMVFLLMAMLIFVSMVSLCHVEGSSMLNTISDEDYLLLYKNPSSYTYHDIVVVDVGGDGGSHELIKRIIALQDDMLIFMDNPENVFYVDLYLKKSNERYFVKLNEDYIKDPMTKTFFKSKYTPLVTVSAYVNLEGFDFSLDQSQWTTSQTEAYNKIESKIITVPQSHIYYLGDNRNDSYDARYYGSREIDKIYGKYFYKVKKNSLLEKFLRFIYKEKKFSEENTNG